MLYIHIVAGLVSLVAGALALFAAKGATLHRRAGIVFAAAMLTMTSSAVVMAALLRPNRVNVVAGTLTFYLVATGLLAVTRRVEQARGRLAALLAVALAISAYALSVAADGAAHPRGLVDGVPATALYVFAAVGLFGAAMDARMLVAGRLEGTARLTRHLWRMGFAMFVATGSFFLGQADEFPAAMRTPFLAVPVLLVVATLVYWSARAIWMRRRPVGEFLGRRARAALARERARGAAREVPRVAAAAASAP